MKHVLALLALLAASPVFANDPSASCFNNLDTHNQLAPLRSVIAVGNIKGQTMEMMTNTAYPTLEERALIKAWVKERDECFVQGESWRIENMPATVRSILDDYYAKNKLLIADLYVLKITYGEFAARRAAQSSELSAALNEAWRKHRAGLVPSTASEKYLEQQRAAERAAMLEGATRIFSEEPLSPSGLR